MDRGIVILFGALLTFTSSWVGLILYPVWQLQAEPPADGYPPPPTEKALAGQRVYQANGCVYCHSQQVRSERFGNWWEDGVQKTGADIKRGWGPRRTVSRDYVHDWPVLLGTMRTGPDLASVGPRYSAKWQHAHLFNPRALNGWSNMPSFAFLYRREPVAGARSPAAVDVGREWTVNPGKRWRPTDAEWDAVVAAQGDAIAKAAAAGGTAVDVGSTEGRQQLLAYWLTTPEATHQVVPTEDAENLVEYLLALNKTARDLPEAVE